MNPSLFKNRSFVSTWIGNGISELGGAFGTFCNSILIYQLTGSTLALGSMWLLYFIPSLILQLFIGPYIDRWSRKWIMILSQWTRGAIFVIPLAALVSGNLEVWHIYVVQCVVGLITPFYVPANHAITPTIVEKEQLQSANAIIDGTVRLMTFLSPIVAGIVIEYIGVHITLILVSSMLIMSGFTLLFIQEKRSNIKVRKTWLADFTEGISFFFSHKIIVWLGIFLAFVQFGVGVTMVTTLPYITEELGGTYAEYGYFMAGFPIGYIVGAIIVTRIKYKSRRLLMLGSLFIGGITFIALCFNYSILIAITTETIGGIGMAIFSIHNTTIIQKTVPNHLIGKVFSVRLLIIRGVMPLGVLIGGVLSELLGVRPLYLFIGLLISITSLAGLCLPYFKFIEIPVKDIQKSIAWYTEVLGLELIWNSEEEKLAQLNLPSGQMIFLNETIEDTTANFLKNGEVHNVIGFQTSNINHVYNHLINNAVQVEEIVDDGLGNNFLHFYDLDGNKFCVQYDK